MKAQLAILRKLNAPEELIKSFIEVCEINDRLCEVRASYNELLEEKCAQFGFNLILDEGWFFRPYNCGGEARRSDTAPSQSDPEGPAIEQAYRRGFDQGFADCVHLVDQKALNAIKLRQLEIHKWRTRRVQEFGSQPGALEKPDRNIFGGRSAISLKIRWKIFSRDGFRCRACGAGTMDGVRLEVDHVIAVSLGGSDQYENLQTLCFDCNRGKSNLP